MIFAWHNTPSLLITALTSVDMVYVLGITDAVVESSSTTAGLYLELFQDLGLIDAHQHTTTNKLERALRVAEFATQVRTPAELEPLDLAGLQQISLLTRGQYDDVVDAFTQALEVAAHLLDEYLPAVCVSSAIY